MKITKVQVRTATFAQELVSDIPQLLKSEGVINVDSLCKRLKSKYKAPILYTFIGSKGIKFNSKDEKAIAEGCTAIKFEVRLHEQNIDIGPYKISFPFDVNKFHKALTALDREAISAEQYAISGR